jgi:hypothetical protein
MVRLLQILTAIAQYRDKQAVADTIMPISGTATGTDRY